MEENEKALFIDSNFFIALYNPVDSLHAIAKQISSKVRQSTYRIYLSNFIFLETVTVLSQKMNRQNAILSGKKLLQSHEFIEIDKKLQKRTWQIFQATTKKNISFIDCSILAVMEYEDIPYLLTFDKKDFGSLRKKFDFEFYE